MSDYTAHIIIKDPDYISATAQYLKGDIVSIYPLVTEMHSPSNKLAFIHVVNVPEGVRVANLKTELARTVNNTVSLANEVIDRSAWCVDLSQLDANLLMKDNQLTIDWVKAQECFIRKIDNKTGGQFYAELIS